MDSLTDELGVEGQWKSFQDDNGTAELRGFESGLFQSLCFDCA